MISYIIKILFSIIKILFLLLLFFFFLSFLFLCLSHRPLATSTRDQHPSSKPTWPCSCDCKIPRAWMSFEGDPKRCFILWSPKGWVSRPHADLIHRVPSRRQREARGEPGLDWRMGQDRLKGRLGRIHVPWAQR